MKSEGKIKAIFIDRDGTINEEAGYINHVDLFMLLPRSIEAIRLINMSPFKAVMVTNQAGVAKGYFPEELVLSIHDKLKGLLDKEGAYLDGIYYCPHHPEGSVEKYRIQCECRKPRPGLLLKAAEDLDIVLSRSYLVGDKISDVVLARSVGAKGVLVLTGYGKGEVENFGNGWGGVKKPVYIAEDLYDAVEWILDVEGQRVD
mgnify:CR=1 FL=1